MRIFQRLILEAVFMAGALAPAVKCQAPEPTSPSLDEVTLSGTVVSTSKSTLIIRTQANAHLLFVLDRDTVKPQQMPYGARVTVTSVPSGESGVRLARIVSLGGEAERAQADSQPTSSSNPPPVPPAMRRLQSDIERHTRNLVFGVRAGIGLNPEVIDVGAHARMGPIFFPDIQFRPSAEFGFGEVTKFFGVNADVSYRLPLTPRWSTWSTYLAAGPAFGFSQQHFEKTNGSGSGIDFGNLEFTPGLNVVAGLESRRGYLVEFRSTIYASPNPIFRLMFGYSF